MQQKIKAWGYTVVVLAVVLVGGCGGRQFAPRLTVEPLPEAEQSAQTSAWLEVIRAQGKPGDWLIVRGYKGTDNFIVSMTNIPLSHAAILDIERDLVVESQTPGVIETGLQDFINHSHRVILIRPKWWSDARAPEIIKAARDLVGHAYDFTGLVGLDDDERFYCTELAFHIYKPYQAERDRLPLVIEPGQMYLWGTILWDSGERD